MNPLTCGRCGAEVRHGTRDGGLTVAWLHRDPAVDHVAILGVPYSPEQVEQWEAALDEPRTRTVVRRKKINATKSKPAHHEEWTEEEIYTTREVDFKKMAKEARERQAAEDLDEDEEPESPLEPVEVYSTPSPTIGVLEVDGRTVKVPGGARTLILAAEATGWEIVEFTYARGPYMGAKGGSLGVADSHRLTLRGPDAVDGTPRLAVAWWRNAKSDRVWRIENKTVTVTGAKALGAWMKEVPSGQE